jgi:hypothetical protein
MSWPRLDAFHCADQRRACSTEREERRATLALPTAVGGGKTWVLPPEPDATYWREGGGARHSYQTLRRLLDPRLGAELREAHLAAIHRIAAAALSAAERGDRRETARLATAAARLCGEIRGLWPASAVEIRRQ